MRLRLRRCFKKKKKRREVTPLYTRPCTNSLEDDENKNAGKQKIIILNKRKRDPFETMEIILATPEDKTSSHSAFRNAAATTATNRRCGIERAPHILLLRFGTRLALISLGSHRVCNREHLLIPLSNSQTARQASRWQTRENERVSREESFEREGEEQERVRRSH